MIEKDLNCFRQNVKGYKNGIFAWCRNCVNNYAKNYVGNDIIVEKQTCRVCNKEKHATEFSKSKTRKTGLDSRCKDCYRDITRTRRGGRNERWLEIEELKQKYLFKCSRCKKIFDLTLRRNRKDYTCRECKNAAPRQQLYNSEKRRKEYLEHPFRYKEQRARRRARIRNAEGSATKTQIKAKFDYYGNRCIYCGCRENLTVEHIKPLSRGGSNWPANLAPACKNCNLRKGDRKLGEWIYESSS